MATRAETARAENARHGITPKARKKNRARKAHDKKRGAQANAHAGRKATYAFEKVPNGATRSRKSSRAGANRMKADSNLTLREGRKDRSSKVRNSKARIRSSRVRGH
jgi:hypothetical protein